MKRLLLTLTIAFSFFSLSSFANDNVTPQALQAFRSSFKNATEVQWSVSNNYFKANFAMNGEYISAYYDNDGKMVALTRNISSLQLPLVLQTEMREKGKTGETGLHSEWQAQGLKVVELEYYQEQG